MKKRQEATFLGICREQTGSYRKLLTDAWVGAAQSDAGLLEGGFKERGRRLLGMAIVIADMSTQGSR